MFTITKKKSNEASFSHQNIEQINTCMFENLNIYLLPNGMGRNRFNLFKNSLIKYKCNLIDENKEIHFEKKNEFSQNQKDEFDREGIKWIVIIDEIAFCTWDQIEKSLSEKKFFTSFILKFKDTKLNSLPMRFVNSNWLSECLKQKKLLATENYELTPKFNINASCEFKRESSCLNDDQNFPSKKKVRANKADDSFINKECQEKESNTSRNSDNDKFHDNQLCFENINVDSLTCANSSKELKINSNRLILEKLEELASIYESTRDKFRANSYQKAIMAIKRLHEPIRTREVKNLIYKIYKSIQ
jgi:hypothetical protein